MTRIEERLRKVRQTGPPTPPPPPPQKNPQKIKNKNTPETEIASASTNEVKWGPLITSVKNARDSVRALYVTKIFILTTYPSQLLMK